MNISVEDLNGAWAKLESTTSGGREYRALRLCTEGAVAIYAALREVDGLQSIIFEGALSLAPQVRTKFSGEGISFHDYRDHASQTYRLVATLESAAFRELFEVLACDLAQVAESSVQSTNPLDGLRHRIEAWMAFLRRRLAGLSFEEVIGLYGELTFLNFAIGRAGLVRGLSAWQGPNRSLHDFIGDGVAVEIKTILGGSSVIHVSGLGQLDDSGLRCLVVGLYRLVPDLTGQSLRELVRVTRERVAAEGTTCALEELDAKLLAYGYIESMTNETFDARYGVRDSRFLRIADDFPRLIPGAVPLEVRAATYSLDLGPTDRFALTDHDFEVLVRELGGGGRE